jgi:hypothetical protein
MKTIKLKQYGAVLTGREFGAEVWSQISKGLSEIHSLDFSGVESMGSSFGDEVIPKLAKHQGNSVVAINVNEDLRGVIEDVASDAGIQVEFK